MRAAEPRSPSRLAAGRCETEESGPEKHGVGVRPVRRVRDARLPRLFGEDGTWDDANCLLQWDYDHFDLVSGGQADARAVALSDQGLVNPLGPFAFG